MKYGKVIIMIAIIALLTACAPTTKHLNKAEKLIDKREYVKAAESIEKIKPRDFNYWIEKESINAARTIMVATYLYNENNRQANMILGGWVQNLRSEIDKDEFLHYIYKYNLSYPNFY